LRYVKVIEARQVACPQPAEAESVAPSFGVELKPVDVRDAGEIEHAINAFAHQANGGLIVTVNASALLHRELIITFAAPSAARGLLGSRLCRRPAV
jgi:hypothetical protein